MTDEERKLICAVLRQVGGYWYRHPDGSTRNCGKEAADEIERLERELNSTLGLLYQESERRVEAADEIERLAALAQSDTELVAWRVRDFGDGWILCHSRKQAEKEAERSGNLIQPLYTAFMRRQ